MSRGPTKEVGISEGRDYAEALRAANQMVNQGRSWSGSEPNCCFLNTAGPRFADVSAITGLDHLDDARAIAFVDWDTDGDLDLLQVNRTAPQVRFLRNDWQSDHHWLAVQLVGTGCNRDAIGARVELYRDGVAGKDIRTLYAGSSFLSQSSKWMHFGLGKSDKIQRLVVRWPGGKAETFTGFVVNRRYRLVQGSGRIEPVVHRRPHVQLKPSILAAPAESQRSRVVLGAPVPLPLLRYSTLACQQLPVESNEATLIQLWASWCPTCQAELSEFTKRAQDVRNSGIRVMALSVDGLGEDTTDPEQTVRAVHKLGIPFATGRATEEMLDKLELLRGELFSNSLPFPVPTSFLIDSRGQLVVIYLGPVEVDQLLRDAHLLEIPIETLRQEAAPLGGRWLTGAKPFRLVGMPKLFREAGYESDAAWYEKQAAPQMALSHCSLALDCERRNDLKTAWAHYQRALSLDAQSGRVHNMYGEHLMRRRRMAEALESFRKAIQLDPDLADAHHNLATVLVLEHQTSQAIQSYREAVRLDPQLAKSHAALGRLLQREGRQEEAENHLLAAVSADAELAPPHVYLGHMRFRQQRYSAAAEHFGRAVAVSPRLPDAHEGLAEALAAQGQIAQALPHYREALRWNPDSLGAATNLAWHLCTCWDERLRSAREAVLLAERVVVRTRHKSPRALDVLAAAYAEAGRFQEAVTVATKGAELAANMDQPLSRQILKRLALYKNRKPFRQNRHSNLEKSRS